MIKIPVTLGFHNEKIIGFLEVDEKQLPPTPDYHFALGYRMLDAEYNNEKFSVTKYELLTVAAIPDTKFRSYD